MKRYLTLIILMFTFITSYSQIAWFNTTAYAEATIYNGSYHWSSWQSSDMLISIDTSKDLIKIYSPVPQSYFVLEAANNGNFMYDNSGGKLLKFYVIDQDGDRGEIRLRQERNGNHQLYIDFSNITWVYNIVPK